MWDEGQRVGAEAGAAMVGGGGERVDEHTMDADICPLLSPQKNW